MAAKPLDHIHFVGIVAEWLVAVLWKRTRTRLESQRGTNQPTTLLQALCRNAACGERPNRDRGVALFNGQRLITSPRARCSACNPPTAPHPLTTPPPPCTVIGRVPRPLFITKRAAGSSGERRKGQVALRRPCCSVCGLSRCWSLSVWYALGTRGHTPQVWNHACCSAA